MALCRNQILQLSGINGESMAEEEAANTVAELLQESEKLFGHKTRVEENTAVPILTKYYYKKATGVHTEIGSVDYQDWDKKATPSKKMLRDVRRCNVKVENPEYHQLKKTCKVLMDGNKKGSNKLNQAEIEIAKSKASGKNYNSLQKAMENFKLVLGEVRDFVAATEVGVTIETDQARIGNLGVGNLDQLLA